MTDQLTDPMLAGQLLDLADRAVVDGLEGRQPTIPLVGDLPHELRRPAGTFVSLHVGGELNGCIGSIEPTDPLGVSVARHAWSAAFADPRLPQLRWVDYEHLDIAISLLTPLTPIPSRSRAELLATLQPHQDGLVITAGKRRAVFLPSVWTQLPDPDRFLEQLAQKAGIDLDRHAGRWPSTLQAFTFRTESISR